MVEHLASFLLYFILAAREKQARKFISNIKGGRKINYYDYLTKVENTDCNEAVKRVFGRLDMEEIRHFIEEIPYISDLQKAFYKKYINARASLTLAPAYEMILAGG